MEDDIKHVIVCVLITYSCSVDFQFARDLHLLVIKMKRLQFQPTITYRLMCIDLDFFESQSFKYSRSDAQCLLSISKSKIIIYDLEISMAKICNYS